MANSQRYHNWGELFIRVPKTLIKDNPKTSTQTNKTVQSVSQKARELGTCSPHSTPNACFVRTARPLASLPETPPKLSYVHTRAFVHSRFFGHISPAILSTLMRISCGGIIYLAILNGKIKKVDISATIVKYEFSSYIWQRREVRVTVPYNCGPDDLGWPTRLQLPKLGASLYTWERFKPEENPRISLACYHEVFL